MRDRYDVVVVGGGPAGLAGALCLARSRRTVLVVDAGSPRNDPAEHVHDYLGRDGDPPGALLADGRQEVARHGGQCLAGTVVSAQRLDLPPGGSDGPGFRVRLEGGRSVLARRLLLTTGLVDELPDVAGLAARWGRDVIHCPYCHGWEWRDEPLAVLGTGPTAVPQALLFRQWSTDVTLVRHTAGEPGQEERERLAARGIPVVAGEVSGLEVAQDRITGLRLVSGELVACRAVVVVPRFTVRSGLIDSLGLETEQVRTGDDVEGTRVPSAPTGATEVPGVYVAGNVTDLHAQVLAAAAAGLTTATAINTDLLEEDLQRAVAERRPVPRQEPSNAPGDCSPDSGRCEP
jgi:thioredoxin reductase